MIHVQAGSMNPVATGSSSLLPECRRQVLWIGVNPPSDAFKAACRMPKLVLRVVDQGRVSSAASTARALLVEVSHDDPEFPEWGRCVVEEALAHGLVVGFVMPEDDSELPDLPDPEVILCLHAAVTAVKSDDPRVRVFIRKWDPIVWWAVDHKPGPGANTDLRINGYDVNVPAIITLLQRAFHDLDRISLQPIDGGKSGASVWMVEPDPEDGSARTLPFVAKLHTREKMGRERSNYLLVRNAVPQYLHAPLDEQRCVEGDTLALAVYDLVSRARPFRSALLDVGPGVLVASLFEHTLGPWLSRTSAVTAPLAAQFDQGGVVPVLRWSEALRELAEVAQETIPGLPDVDALRAQLAHLPCSPFRTTTVHGDLHAGNLLVRGNTSEVVLIDFGSVQSTAPLVSDPACLEVSLTFAGRTVPDSSWPETGSPKVDAKWLRSVYKYPLEPSAVQVTSGAGAWLGQSVRAIRSQARQHEPEPTAYAVAVAAYLIRYASYDDHGTLADRALAYELACGLIEAVESELVGRKQMQRVHAARSDNVC